MGSLRTPPKRGYTIAANEPRARIVVRLREGREGAIPLSELGGLAEHLQDAVRRLARGIAGRSGRGRSPAYLDRLTELDAVSIGPGSAVLEIEAPAESVELPMDVPEHDIGVQALRELTVALESVARDAVIPLELDDASRHSIAALVVSLAGRDRVDIETQIGGERGVVRLNPREASQLIHRTESGQSQASTVTVHGELYHVNLRTHLYTIEDDAGHAIPCLLSGELATAATARSLVGKAVVAHGTAELGPGGRIQRLRVDSMAEAGPKGPGEDSRFDLQAALGTAPSVTSLGEMRLEHLDEDDVQSFWNAVTSE